MTILYLNKTHRMKAENSIISKAWWSEESVKMAQKQKNVPRGEDYIYQQTETGSEKDNSQKAGLAKKKRTARAIWIIKEYEIGQKVFNYFGCILEHEIC